MKLRERKYDLEYIKWKIIVDVVAQIYHHCLRKLGIVKIKSARIIGWMRKIRDI